MLAALGGREDTALGRLQFAGTFPLDGHSAQAAGTAAAAGGGNADPGLVQHREKLVAPGRVDALPAVHGDADGALRQQPVARGDQRQREADDEERYEDGTERDLRHGAAICAKEEKPSDIMPPARR